MSRRPPGRVPWRALIFAAALAGAPAALTAPACAAELRIGMAADVTTLDPHHVAAQPNLQVAWHVFDALTRVDERTRLIPGLAESWRAIDPLTWEFRLRRGVRFHDGSDFTAEDVVFSLERPLTLTGSAGGFAAYVRPIVAKEIVDPWTIRLKTATPYGALPQDLNSIFIVSRRAAAGAAAADFDSGKAMVGTGPYRFVRFARGDRIELARFEGYREAKPAWDRVTLRLMSADPVRTAALLAGDVDAIEQVPTADFTRLRGNPRYAVVQATSWRTIFLHLDQHRARPPGVAGPDGRPLGSNPFMDPRVRRAVSVAINRTAVVERVLEGLAVPAANIVSPGVFGHNPALQPDPYDPALARRLLAEAGYPGGFEVTLAAPNNRYVNDEQVAQAVAQMLTRVGIRTRVEALPFNVYLTKVRNQEFALAMLGWGSFAGDLALRSLVATPDAARGWGAWNWSRYSSPQADRLIGEALGSVDGQRREALALEAAAVALGDRALIPLHHQTATWAMRRGLSYAARTDEYTFAHHFRSEGAGSGKQ